MPDVRCLVAGCTTHPEAFTAPGALSAALIDAHGWAPGTALVKARAAFPKTEMPARTTWPAAVGPVTRREPRTAEHSLGAPFKCEKCGKSTARMHARQRFCSDCRAKSVGCGYCHRVGGTHSAKCKKAKRKGGATSVASKSGARRVVAAHSGAPASNGLIAGLRAEIAKLDRKKALLEQVVAGLEG